MVESWRAHPLFESRMHIIDDALAAHKSKMYTLSVPALLPLVEGILTEYVTVHNLAARCGKIKQVYESVFSSSDDYSFSSRPIVLTILFQLQHNTYAWTNFEAEMQRGHHRRQITRHTVLHGISTNYDTLVTSLKIFTLLDAISALHAQLESIHGS